MSAALSWAGDEDGLPVQKSDCPSKASAWRQQPGPFPPGLGQAIWRGANLERQASAVVSSGFAALDAEFPGGGWPCQALSEILSPQPSVVEWRLLGPALRGVVAAGGQIVLVGPPRIPHLPGLRHCGLDDRHLVWVQAEAPAERLWCAEQLVRAGACGALVAWLPQARPEQIRRLQVCAQACQGPVFLFRPASAQHEASAAPLRVVATFGLDWELHVQVLKRRGPPHDGIIRLPSIPGGLEAILTPRLQRPSRLVAARLPAREPVQEVPVNAVGSASASPWPRRHATVR